MIDVTSPFWPIWTAVADTTGLCAGLAALDVGCGTGEFCELAAARGAAVHGLDGMADRIDRARRRVPDGDFRIGLMESLPWPPDRFDVTTGINAFQYAFDVDLALTEAMRVTRRGGRVAVCKWGPPQNNEFFAFLAELGVGGEPLERLGGTDAIEAAMERVGLEVVASGEVPAVMHMATAEALETNLLSAGASLGADGRESWQRKFIAAASPFRRADGSYRFENRLRYRIAEV